MKSLVRQPAFLRAARTFPLLSADFFDSRPFRFDVALLLSFDFVQQQAAS
jgi:hypothetical protein